MDENITAEERLKRLNEERKSLKAQVLGERETRLKEAADMRVIRDGEIEKIQVKVKSILAIIFSYNKLGKVAKVDYDVLQKISETIDHPDEEEVVAESSE